MIVDLIAPVLAAISAVVAAGLAYKGTKDTDSTDKLSRAAGLYSDYADKMEKRVAAVEEKNSTLSENQDRMESRLQIAEDEAKKYQKESSDYKKVLLEVIQWITELLDWEVRGYSDPKPHFTLNMVLTHLTNFMQGKEQSDSENKRVDRDGT